MKSNHILFLLLIFLFSSSNILAQSNKNAKAELVMLDGDLIMFHPYTFEMDTSIKMYFTFNDVPLEPSYYGSKVAYTIATMKWGMLGIYRIDKTGDTVLIEKRRLKFKEPKYTVSFARVNSGLLINSDNLRYKELQVMVENTNISIEPFPISHVKLCYMFNGILECTETNGAVIPDATINRIKATKSNILVFEIQVKLGDKFLNVPPVVYYFKQ
jgi:hypothetical protein